jgi:fumarate hydratase class II
VAQAIDGELVAQLQRLAGVLADKARQWDAIIKIGRTHLADATPIRLGQEFSGYARQVELSVERAGRGIEALRELPAGGTAVGTGINTHPKFGAKVAEVLAKETDIGFVEAENHFEANANRDALVECSGDLRAVAVSLFTVANNIRWLGSGPRCGFHEIVIPDLQPGSSIMPGKVNPVMCESMMQVCARVIGNDQAVAFAGATGGNFELNIMMPMMAATALETCYLLAGATKAFVDFCALDLEANAQACQAAVEESLAMVTSLNPHIGYERAAALAKEAFETGQTIRQLCRDQKVLPDDVLDEALDPRRMTEPR